LRRTLHVLIGVGVRDDDAHVGTVRGQ
jgi:hypothetical protein